MAFASVNEIERFSFEDCQLVSMEIRGGSLVLTADAVIVKARNSQNSHFTDSYADTLVMTLEGGRVDKAVEEGFTRYDANEVLVEEVPDRPLSARELKDLAASCGGFYLFTFERLGKEEDRFQYVLEIEDPGEDTYDVTASRTYELTVSFDKAVFTWDRFLNHVER